MATNDGAEHPDQTDTTGWSASGYNKNAAFVYSAASTSPVLSLLAAKPGERIIDFGCGSGEVSLELQKYVTSAEGGIVVGVDFSESMIAQAKKNGVKYTFVADIQALKLPENTPSVEEKFNAVFSNAALHWCKQNPAGVLESAKKVLKPGGRIAAEMGGFMNCIGLRSAIHMALRARGYDPIQRDPWFFPSIEDYTKLLVHAGFKLDNISLTPRVTYLPTDLSGWLHLFVRHSFLADLSDEVAKEIIDEVVEMCRVDCQDESGKWALMYNRLRFRATLA